MSKASDTPAANGTQAASGTADDSTSGGRLHDAAGAVRDAAGNAFSAVKDKSGAAYSAAADRTGEALGGAREKASQAYEAARDKASQAKQATAESIEGNPFVAVLGGVALGALVGALLPRSQKEQELLAPVADRLAETARSAVAAARDAGKQALDEAGVNADNARGQVEKIVDTAVKAASSASTAAAGAVRQG